MIPKLRIIALLGASMVVAAPAEAQTAGPGTAKNDMSSAYYHAALGHLYGDLAAQYGGRGEYVQKAIDNFKLAMRSDPDSTYLAEELADLYIGTGQFRSATNEFEEVVKRNPADLNARRILGRIYMARLREGNQSRANAEMLGKALEQYEKVSEKAPKDSSNWVMLGRLYKLASRSKDAETAYKKALEIDADNEEAMTGLAIVYSDLGDNLNATAMLKRVTDKNPSLRTLTALAGTYEQMKEYKLAAEAYKRALDLNSANTDLKRAYAQSLFQADDNDAAVKVFEELLAEDPSDLLANLRLSQIYRQKRDFTKAKEYARKARDLDPTNLEIRFNEVGLLEAEGKTQEAIAVARELVDTMAKDTSTPAARNNRVILLDNLARLHRQAEQVDQAVSIYREIGQLDADAAPKAAAQIVETYRSAKMLKEAEKESQEALAKYPGDRLLKLVAANIQADLGHFDKAAGGLKSMLDGQNDRETYLAMAQIYEKSKNYAEMGKAIDNAERLASSDDEKENIWFMRGAMLEKMKRFDASEAEFRKVLKQNPQSAGALNYLGYMLADRNVRLNEALEMIQKAVDQEPANGAYLDSLGWVYFRLNRLGEAEEYLQKALAHTPADPAVRDHMADVYAERGRLKEAIAQWELSLKGYHESLPGEADPSDIEKVQKKLEGAKVRLAKETSNK